MSKLGLSEFADKINALMSSIMREFIRSHGDEFHKLKITMPQFFVLELLNRSGELRMSDIAKSINVTTAAVTSIVDRLVREGYVIRMSDPRDRRIVKIRLTTKGVKTVKDMIENRKQITIKMFGMISEKERDTYLKILIRMRDKIQGNSLAKRSSPS